MPYVDQVGTSEVPYVDQVGTRQVPHGDKVGTSEIPYGDQANTSKVAYRDQTGADEYKSQSIKVKIFYMARNISEEIILTLFCGVNYQQL